MYNFIVSIEYVFQIIHAILNILVVYTCIYVCVFTCTISLYQENVYLFKIVYYYVLLYI